MNFQRRSFWSIIILICFSTSLLFGSDDIKAVSPRAMPEAKALLKFFYSISGKYILSGQHNYPNVKYRNSDFAAKYTGKTPIIFSTDWGFAKEGDKDSYLARPDIVEQAKKLHRLGSIIMLCWHAVPPTADEPITFHPPFGMNNPDSLASVQGQLLDRQFKDVLTPGTLLYKRWCAQVDSIAFYLKQLKKAHIPVLWRPYHEMNGSWFWWGGRSGENGTIALYRQIFNRLVKHHKLNNLIWVWSVDRPVRPEMNYVDFYPGDKYFDIVALDVYRNDFKQPYYDSLVVMAKGKPLILGEVGNPPSPEIMKNQLKWSSYVIWSGMVRNTLKKQYKEFMMNERILGLEDTVYRKAIVPYRIACKLPQLPLYDIKPDSVKIDFSGEWVFNQESSRVDSFGAGNIPYKMIITQKGNELAVQKTLILEYADDRITNDTVVVDGKEYRSEVRSFPHITKTRWSEKNDTLIVESKIILNREGQASEMISNEYWTLQDHGAILSVKQFSSSPWGERKITILYDRI
jgi:mannan endo-1,4-beta-mannosidase